MNINCITGSAAMVLVSLATLSGCQLHNSPGAAAPTSQPTTTGRPIPPAANLITAANRVIAESNSVTAVVPIQHNGFEQYVTVKAFRGSPDSEVSLVYGRNGQATFRRVDGKTVVYGNADYYEGLFKKLGGRFDDAMRRRLVEKWVVNSWSDSPPFDELTYEKITQQARFAESGPLTNVMVAVSKDHWVGFNTFKLTDLRGGRGLYMVNAYDRHEPVAYNEPRESARPGQPPKEYRWSNWNRTQPLRHIDPAQIVTK